MYDQQIAFSPDAIDGSAIGIKRAGNDFRIGHGRLVRIRLVHGDACSLGLKQTVQRPSEAVELSSHMNMSMFMASGDRKVTDSRLQVLGAVHAACQGYLDSVGLRPPLAESDKLCS